MDDQKSCAGKTPGREQAPAETQALTEKQVEQGYVDSVNAMFEDSDARRTRHILADVLAWKLAVIACGSGPEATGHILRRLGHHMGYVSEQRRACEEAERAKEEGRMPH
mgnify:CR=1 FL=1